MRLVSNTLPKYLLKVCFSRGEGINVGLVALFLGRNRDGVPVLELFDTVAEILVDLLLC